MSRPVLLIPFACLLSLATACGEPSTAPDPTSLGEYGFVIERDDQFLVVDGRGTMRPVLPQGVSGFMPDVSADGSRIVFVHPARKPDATYRLEIATIRLDGTGLQVLTGPVESGLTPRWSPDGATIAYSMSTADGTYFDDLVVRPAAGSPAVEHLLEGTWDDAVYSAWSPDGNRIAFEWGSTGIWMVRRDGTGLQRLTAERDGRPDWSPDGSRIAFDRLLDPGRVVCILTIATRSETCLDIGGWTAMPRWSPDGQWLAFIGDTGGLFTVRPDGSSPEERIPGTVMGAGDYDWVKLR